MMASREVSRVDNLYIGVRGGLQEVREAPDQVTDYLLERIATAEARDTGEGAKSSGHGQGDRRQGDRRMDGR